MGRLEEAAIVQTQGAVRNRVPDVASHHLHLVGGDFDDDVAMPRVIAAVLMLVVDAIPPGPAHQIANLRLPFAQLVAVVARLRLALQEILYRAKDIHGVLRTVVEAVPRAGCPHDPGDESSRPRDAVVEASEGIVVDPVFPILAHVLVVRSLPFLMTDVGGVPGNIVGLLAELPPFGKRYRGGSDAEAAHARSRH